MTSHFYTYRQRSVSMLIPETVQLLLDFPHDMLSICHHLLSTVRSSILNGLSYSLFRPEIIKKNVNSLHSKRRNNGTRNGLNGENSNRVDIIKMCSSATGRMELHIWIAESSDRSLVIFFNSYINFRKSNEQLTVISIFKMQNKTAFTLPIECNPL